MPFRRYRAVDAGAPGAGSAGEGPRAGGPLSVQPSFRQRLAIGVAAALAGASAALAVAAPGSPLVGDVQQPAFPTVSDEVQGPAADLDVADFDRDGARDVVVALPSWTAFGASQPAFGVLDGVRGARTLRPRDPGQNVSGGVTDVTVGDVDLDGDDDLVTVGDTQLSPVRNDGGSFAESDVDGLLTLPSPGSAVALSDSDRDGDLDAFVATPGTDTLQRFDGDPFGSGFSTRTGITVGTDVHEALLADLDGNGWDDLVLSRWAGGNTVDVRLNDRGVFSPTGTSVPGGPAERVEVVDQDQDGDLDVLAAMFDGGVDVLRNDGGVLTRAHLVDGNAVSGVGQSDLDRDGTPDLASSDVGGSLVVHAGQGPGTFGPADAISLASPRDIVTGDQDRDGRPDLVVGTGDHRAPVAIVGNLSAVAAPNALGRPADEQGSGSMSDPVQADVDRDGRLDVVAGTDDGLVVVRRGRDPLEVTLGEPPRDVAVADVNRDGAPDLLAALPARVAVAYAGADGFTVDEVPAGGDLVAIDSGDMDRDGDEDVVLVDRAGAGGPGVYQLRNDGNGRFPGTPSLDVGGSAFVDVAVADLDRDGLIDYATLDREPDAAAGWSLHRETDGWITSSFGTGSGAAPAGRLTVGDVDGDGWPDLAYPVALHDETAGDGGPVPRGGVDVWRGAGRFSRTLDTVGRDLVATGVAFGDVTRDGRGDLVLSGRDARDDTPRLAVLRDTGVAYEPWRSADLDVASSSGAFVDDVDRDGFLDALVAVPDALRVVRTLDDDAAPGVTFTPVPALTRSPDVTWTFTVDDDGPTAVTCELDTARVDCTSGSVAATALPDGPHTLRVTAVDAASQSTTEASTVTVDGTAPSADVSGAPPLTRSRRPALPFTSDDPTATAQCALPGFSASLVPCASPFVPGVDLPDGTYELEVTVTDPAGNASNGRAPFRVDTTAPAVMLTGVPQGSRNATSETATFTAAGRPDEALTLECRLDGVLLASCTPAGTELTIAGADGPREFAVRVTDPAGNVTDVAATWTFDRTAPPLPSVTGAPSGATQATGATLTLAGGGDTAAFRCTVDARDPAPCGPTLVLSGLTDGTHRVRVVALDAAGNASAETERAWVVDTTAPDLSLGTGPAGRTNATAASLAFDVSDDATRVTCRLDDAAAAPCSSPFEVDDLGADGPKTLRVAAADAQGNAVERSFSFALDRAAPVPSITGGPTGAVSSPDAVFALAATDDDPTVALTCRVGAATEPFEPCGASKTLRSLRDGSYTLTLRATDQAGNAQDAVRTWTVDTAAPTARIASGPSGPQSSREAAFDVEGDPGTTLTCSINDAPVDCDVPVRDLADGTYVFGVVATDAAGNTSPPVMQTFAVDTAPPAAPATEGPPAEVQPGGTSTVTFGSTDPESTFECALDGGGFAPCSSPVTHSGLSPGEHRLAVRAIDRAGNRGVPTETRWRVAAPVVAQEQPQPQPQPPGPPAPPADPPAEQPAPVFQQTVAVKASGKACFTPPRSKTCEPLGDGKLIPIGSVIDTTAKGAFVDLTTAGPDGKLQTARFYEGLFRVGQVPGPKGQITELTLVGPLVCPTTSSKGKARKSAARKKKTRRLWGDGKGNFRTKGRYGAATVRGTKWKVEDLCEGTKITVAVGVVDALDLVRKRTRQLKAGQNVLIKPR